MPTSRKELIFQTIQEYTSKAIVENNLDFSSCNAHILSLNLHIDRSNISRILNQLFQEGKLIKTSGRPTLYISRKIIENLYPFVEIPSILNQDDSLQNYLYSEKEEKKDELSQVVGPKKNGSLYKTISSILPMISRRNNNLYLFSFSGPSGIGKKYLAKNLFQYAKNHQHLEKKASIFYANYSLIVRNPDYILNAIDPIVHKWILIEIFDHYEKIKLSSFLTEMIDLYSNKGTELNAISIIFHNNMNRLFDLSDYYYSQNFTIQPLNERPTIEILELILNFLISNASSFKKEIQLTPLFINKLIQYGQNENVEKLNKTIYGIIALCFFHTSKNPRIPLVLDDSYMPNNIKYTKEDPKLSLYLSKLADTIHIAPSTQLNKLLNYENEQININLSSEFENNLQYAILNAPTNFKDPTSLTNEKSDLADKIENIIKNTTLYTDIFLVDFIINTISEFINNRVSIQKFKIPYPKEIKPNVQNMIDSILRIISNSSPEVFHLMESEKYIFAQLINECFVITNESPTPILIITHSSHLSENYAHQFNILARKRIFYSVDFSDFDTNKNIEAVKSRIYNVVTHLNRGKGIYMIANQQLISKLGSNIFTYTKVPVFLFTFGSLSVFLDLITQLDSTKMNSITFSKLITKNTHISQDFVQSNSLCLQDTRESNTYLKSMQIIFPSLNTRLTNNLFYLSLEYLCKQLKISITNSMIIDFLFQGNCLLNKILNKKEHFSLEGDEDMEVFPVIANSLHMFYQFKDIHFESGDIEILYQSLFSQIENISK